MKVLGAIVGFTALSLIEILLLIVLVVFLGGFLTGFIHKMMVPRVVKAVIEKHWRGGLSVSDTEWEDIQVWTREEMKRLTGKGSTE